MPTPVSRERLAAIAAAILILLVNLRIACGMVTIVIGAPARAAC